MFDLPMPEEPPVEEPLGYQPMYDQETPLEELRDFGLPELRDLELDEDPDDTL